MKKFIKYFTFNNVAIVSALIGFAILQSTTHSTTRIFWQEIVFLTAFVIWLKATNVKIWKDCMAILILHTTLTLSANTESVSQEDIIPAYWVSIAICVTIIILISRILKIVNK